MCLPKKKKSDSLNTLKHEILDIQNQFSDIIREQFLKSNYQVNNFL